MANPAIIVEGVSKRFRLNSERHTSLKERVVGVARKRHRRDRSTEQTEFWALRDIDFEVEEGHTVGLLGHNGSGKSTLLKCTGGILTPTTGEIRTKGRLASLLELGAGFHPELSGRRNVYLNASILGLTRRDIDARFDDIVGFAELEKFIDTQVKHYSSGMYVRLGFAVATNVDPDILLVDEVLAVGDEAFQRKCLDRVKQFQKEGRTIVFVTHGADLVRQICDRAVVLDHGNMVLEGLPSEAVRQFREHLLFGDRPEGDSPNLTEAGAGDGDGADGAERTVSPPKLRVVSVEIDYPEVGRPYVRGGEALTVRVGYEANQPVEGAVFALSLYGTDGHVVYGQNTWGAGVSLPVLSGRGEVAFQMASVPLLEGTYPLTIGIHSLDGGEVFDWREQQSHVDVINHANNLAWGVVEVPVEIVVRGSDGQVVPVTPATYGSHPVAQKEPI